MKLNNILSRFKNKKIEVTTVDRWGTGNFKYIVKNGANELEFTENGKGSNHVTCFVARHPDTNAMYDLHMDSYYHTIKSAIEYLNVKS